MHRSKQHLCSIISSARTGTVGGTVRAERPHGAAERCDELARSFDDFVGKGEQRRRNFSAEYLGRLKINKQFVFVRLLYG
jgi:hypothetical protein